MSFKHWMFFVGPWAISAAVVGVSRDYLFGGLFAITVVYLVTGPLSRWIKPATIPQSETIIPGPCEQLAYDIVQLIISSGLVTPECAEDKQHGIVSVWSANVYEQIGQLIAERLPELAEQGRDLNEKASS
jgi:hypothetical protein